jgi:predicted membrane chloride channel (bestrophin family)
MMLSRSPSLRAKTALVIASSQRPSSLVLLGSQNQVAAISSTAFLLKKDGDVVVPTEADLKPVYYIPKAERSKLKMSDRYLEKNRGGETRLNRNSRLCPTRELNFTSDSWALHKSPWRHFRHIMNLFRSAPAQRLAFPDLAWVAAIASGVTYYNVFLTAPDATAMAVNATAFTGATTAIGLLAGFRLNASYGRYEECRIFWGDINNTIRDLACEGLMWMTEDDQKKRFLKLCKAFPMVLMFHLNGKGCHHDMKRRTPASPPFADRVHAEFLAELRDIYSDGKDEGDFERLSRVKYTGGNTPIEVLTMMRETIAACQGKVDAIYARELDEQCQRLCAAFGASERVLRTPLPTGFSRHSSRLLFIWSSLLPFALYPSLGPWGTLPASLFSSYAVLGIEDVGVQLEEPFDILPMRQYSDGMFDVINQMEKNYTPYVSEEGSKK